jgi:hypothetical protein
VDVVVDEVGFGFDYLLSDRKNTGFLLCAVKGLSWVDFVK